MPQSNRLSTWVKLELGRIYISDGIGANSTEVVWEIRQIEQWFSMEWGNGNSSPFPGIIWQCLGYYWYLVSTDQGCC